MSNDTPELENSIEFIKDKIYYVALRTVPRPLPGIHFFTIDRELVYWNFYLDFGPLHLGHTFRFCEILNHKLQDPQIGKNKKKKIYLYSSIHPNQRVNAICILTCWGILYNNMTPEEAYQAFQSLSSTFLPFHDATQGICTYKLTILDILRGLSKALKNNYIHPNEFNLTEFYHYEKVENGDLTWLSKKFVAFAGPHDIKSCHDGYYTHTPDDYIPYFKKKNVTLVVRLNKKQYDEKPFINAGIDHLDLIYNDGTCPPENLLKKFLEACEKTAGAVAVHCKAGLGRTGTCIGCYMMKHDKFTAKEVIGWLRLCRPGSIIGPQQQFMEEVEQKMWRAGEVHNKNDIIINSQSLSPSKIIDKYGIRTIDSAIKATPVSPHVQMTTIKTIELSLTDDISQGDLLNSQKRKNLITTLSEIK